MIHLTKNELDWSQIAIALSATVGILFSYQDRKKRKQEFLREKREVLYSRIVENISVHNQIFNIHLQYTYFRWRNPVTGNPISLNEALQSLLKPQTFDETFTQSRATFFLMRSFASKKVLKSFKEYLAVLKIVQVRFQNADDGNGPTIKSSEAAVYLDKLTKLASEFENHALRDVQLTSRFEHKSTS